MMDDDRSGDSVGHRGSATDLEDLEDLFENAPCGYVSAEPSGRVVRINHTLAEWTGYTRDQMIGRRFQDLLNIAGKIYFETHFLPLLRLQGRFDEVAFDLVCADGSRLPVLVNAVERRDAWGDVRFLRITVFNAVDRRRYEAELLMARGRLEQLAESQETRIEQGIEDRLRLEETLRQSLKMEAVGQLTGGLAHDFNNLLTGIMGSLELMQIRSAQGRPAIELERYIVAAQESAGKAAALTHRLLAFSRRQTLDPKPTDINQLIGGMEDLLRRSVGSSVEMEVQGDNGLWSALVDANQLENALLNLCINARDAMPDGGRIRIETANRSLDERASGELDMTPGDYLSISVIDNGTGMAPEVVERAFDPFYTTKPLGEGTGLGLSMVYGFARQSGGQARILSEPGRGTTISIFLPRFAGTVGAPDEHADPHEPEHSEEHETILVVDDQPAVRMFVMDILADHGYHAIEASDAASGLQILRAGGRIDLLITDVGLPRGMNGRQLADAGRALRPHLKVLFITGYADNAVIGARHLDRGMEVMIKPFTVEGLAKRVEAMVDPAGLAAARFPATSG